MRKTTRRELVVATTATALTAAVPPAWGRLSSRRAGIGPGRFNDGVASGEPSSSAITFWGRLSTERPRSGARLIVARDSGLDDVVATVKVPTGRGVGHTLKARVGGLDPYEEYYFAWRSATDLSEIGRTRTLPPAGSATPLRIAFSSCQHYNYGNFTPHVHAAAENLDAYIFLGDYIYERGRVPEVPVREDRIDATDLRTYRRKYRTYRTDPGLRDLHRRHPTFHVWDDHEVEDNYSNNNPAPFAAQRFAGYRVAFEWIPRVVYPRDRYRIYKQVSLGGLADLFLIDTRQYRTGDNDGRPRGMLGEGQMRWLIDGLKASRAPWKLIAQQVIMASDPFGTGGSTDQWDGYAADRTRLLSELEAAGIRNVIVLTGDAHVFGCYYAASDFSTLGDGSSQIPTVVEYVGGSVTSPSINVFPEDQVRERAPWTQQYNASVHGYALMALDPEKAVTEYRRSDLSTPAGATTTFERFTQPSGANRVFRESFL